MSDSGRKNIESNKDSKAENNSRLEQNTQSPEARAEIRAAEAKVAWGIKYLYDTSQLYALKHYDGQGIATVTIEPERANDKVKNPFKTPPELCRLGDLFPNGLVNGVTIQFFSKGYTRHPAAFYMLEQKIRSLCNAAKLPPTNIADADLIAQKMEGTVRREFEEKIHAIKTDNKTYPTTQIKDAAFHKAVDDAMKGSSNITLKMLHDKYLETAPINPLDITNFSVQLLDTSAHHRTDTHDILTFNTETQHFSYNEAAEVTAHDRAIGNGCSNLSIAIEGNYDIEKDTGLIKKAQVNNSLVKHASPVAIDDIGKAKITEIDLIADTASNMLEVANSMARLRLHGRQPEDRNKPMKIDWVYQILTTNAGNDENQATTYGYVTRAARLLNHSNLRLGDTPVNLDVSVLNAGINRFAGVGSVPKIFKFFSKIIQKNDTQRRENRHAYRQLTKAVATIKVDPSQLTNDETMQAMFADSVSRLKDILLAAPRANIKDEAAVIMTNKSIEKIDDQITANSKKFAKLRDEYYSLQTLREEFVKSLNDLKKEDKHPDTKPDNKLIELEQNILIINERLAAIPTELAACDRDATANYDAMVIKSNLAEKHQRDRWKTNHLYAHAEVRTLIDLLKQNNNDIQARLNNTETAEATADQVQSICALIYKTYADDLYFGKGDSKYDEIYRTPEKAALFNAYLILFQYLTPGMTCSTGCKSANDRTMVMLLLVAGLANLNEMPPPLHDKSEAAALSTFTKGLSEMVMSISALFATGADTQGATPKVDASKFPYLAGIENLDTISSFGKYAPHKMKHKLPKAKAVAQTDATADHSKLSAAGKATLYQAGATGRKSSISSGVKVGEEQKVLSHTKPRPRSPSKN
jgi:hypothetical protein